MDWLDFFGTFFATYLGVFLGIFIHILVHEAGHLVCGFLSGYRFVSFSFASFVLVKSDGKLKLKRFGIAGAGGQCLMSPPKMVDGNFPVVWYNLGGGVFNFLLSGMFIALFILLRGTLPYAGDFFLTSAVAGVLLGSYNLLPLKLGGLATDGHNLRSLMRSEKARRAFWLLLTSNARMALGERSGDLPAEWFDFAEDYDFNGSVSGNVAAMGVSRHIDRHEFAEARVLAERILSEGGKLIEVLKNEVRCELLFLSIIGEPSGAGIDAVAWLYTPQLKKYIEQSKTHLSKRRLMYAYEKLVRRDGVKAAQALEAFEKVCAVYPYAGDIEGERELLGVVDKVV